MSHMPEGPVSTLPGHKHPLPDGSKCDEHPDRAAVDHIQGETDSFGCETMLMCEECLASYKTEISAEDYNVGKCDWCKTEGVKLREARDYDEGFSGRVYLVCSPCIKKRNDEAAAEIDDRNDYSDWPEDY